METTYGNRLHEKNATSIDELIQIVLKTIKRGGNVIIPSFAVGRTQELIYQFNMFYEHHPEYANVLGNVNVYIDSPMATTATEVFKKNAQVFDEETKNYILSGDHPLDFPNLKFTRNTADSQMLNVDKHPKIIISASGMCEAGRIRHHLKHNLWRANSAVVFVGFQSPGTLGRRLLDGVEKVKLFGEEIAVKAKIVNFQGLSSHADHDHLVQWIKAFDPKPTHVFVVHGDEDVAPVFAEELNSLGFHAHAAKFTECYDLAANEMVSEGYISERKRTAQKSRADNLYAKLVAAAESLLEFAKRCKGRPNKDISALTGQIISLIERFRE